MDLVGCLVALRSRWGDRATWREVTSQWLKYPVGGAIWEEPEGVRGCERSHVSLLFGSAAASRYPDRPRDALWLLAKVPTFSRPPFAQSEFQKLLQTLKIRPSYLS